MSYEHTPVTVDGQVAVLIGGTSGIGLDLARGFAADGADVVASSRRESAVADAAEEIRAQGADTIERTCDVTDDATLETLRDDTLAELGSVDTLVLLAGVIDRRQIDEVTQDAWEDALDVHLDGVRRAIQTFAPEMDDGNIITISSMTAQIGIPNLAAYTAAKGGVESLTRAAAKELGPGIRVNSIAPGFFITPLNRDTYAEGTERRELIDRRTAMDRIGETEELVGAAIYLASDAAAYTTGEVLTVDGGFARSAF